jgi:hypothetical protein
LALSPAQQIRVAAERTGRLHMDKVQVRTFAVMGTTGTETSWRALKPLLQRHLRFAKVSVERHHAFSHGEVRRHAGWLDFDRLSDNYDVQWTEELIEEFADRWDWDLLSYSALIMRSDNLSDAFVERFLARWDPFVLNGGFDDDPKPAPTPHFDALLADMQAKGLLPSPAELAHETDFLEGQWTASRISAEADTIDFSLLSQNPRLGWSVKLLTKYEARWDWDSLAWHHRLWKRVMMPHKDALLDLLLAADIGVLNLASNKSCMEHLPPRVRETTDKQLSVFGPRATVVGVERPSAGGPQYTPLSTSCGVQAVTDAEKAAEGARYGNV